MRIVWRALLVLLTFVGVGYGVMHLLIARGVARGAPEYSVRMGGALGGLFSGGAAAVLVGIALLLSGRPRPSAPDDAREEAKS